VGNQFLRNDAEDKKGCEDMIAIILLALIAIALFGVGFAVHLLWWVALAAAVIWLLGFAAHGGGRRWYYW
jgi:membrane protein YdbS with pleckstrin-like domain